MFKHSEKGLASVADTGVDGGGRFFFSTVREGDQVLFATDDESERTLWVQAVYRATGQSHKPVPPVSQPTKMSNTQLSKVQGGERVCHRFCAIKATCRYGHALLIYA